MAAILAKTDMEGALFHYDECTHVFFPDMLKQKFLSLFLSKCKMFAEKNTVLRINPLFQTCSMDCTKILQLQNNQAVISVNLCNLVMFNILVWKGLAIFFPFHVHCCWRLNVHEILLNC